MGLGAAPLAAQQPPASPFPVYQSPVGATIVSQPPAQTQGTAGLNAAASNAPVPVPNATIYNNVVAPVGGYYPQYGAYGGYMNGRANLVDASGQFMIANQQAALMQQQVTQSQVDTRQKIIQERMYEDSITPKTEDYRQAQLMNKLRYTRNNPNNADIWSGEALNTLFGAINSAGGLARQVRDVPLPEDALKHINLTNNKRTGSIGVLREGGKLDWPLAIQDDSFKKDRETLDNLTPKMVLDATMGRVGAKDLKDVDNIVQRMQANLLRMVQTLEPDDYMDGKKYLRELGNSYKMLKDPDVGNYFGKWAPRGRTVAELMQHMNDNGLTFTAANNGDETYYSALYRSFLSYDSEISQLVARQTSPQ